MGLTVEELDGKYDVTSETSDGGPFILNGDGITEIRNGLTYRKDKNGYIWESAFSIEGDKVRMESTIDPSHAEGENKFIKDEKGNPTSSMMTYHAILDATRVDGRLVLKGEIKHGNISTRLTMTKVEEA